MEYRNDRRWLYLFAAGVLCVTLIPYIIGYTRQGFEWHFTGFVFGVEDGNSYIAKMLIGEAGKWLFRTPYTTYPQNGYFLFLPYILLGKLAAPPETHDQLVALFHIVRLASACFMIFMTYEFISVFIENRNLRRWGTVLATIGGGLGGLYVFGLSNLWVQELPLEFYSPETFGFLSIYGLPHLTLARGLMLLGLIGLLKRRNPLWAGLSWLALGFLQPLTVAIIWSVFGSYILIRYIVLKFKNNLFVKDSWTLWKIDLKNFIIAIVLSSPHVLYVLLYLSRDSFFVEWTKQNIISSPPLTDYLLAYGLFLPFVGIGLKYLWTTETKPQVILLSGWFLLWLPFAYFPYNLQRRLPEGVWVVITILSILGFDKIRWFLKEQLRLLITVVSILPALFLVIGGCLSAWNCDEPLFRRNTEVEVFKYIQSNFPEDTVVLAQYSTANALPAWAPVITPLGHGPESVFLKEIHPKVEMFYAGELQGSDAISMMAEMKIELIVWPREKNMPQFFQVMSAGNGSFKMIYHNSHFEIYQFIPAALP